MGPSPDMSTFFAPVLKVGAVSAASVAVSSPAPQGSLMSFEYSVIRSARATKHLCQAMLSSAAALAIQAQVSDMNVVCPACFKRYPSRTQALRQLSSSAKCASYPEVCEELAADEVLALDAAEAEVLRTKAADDTTDCCAIRSRPTLRGPLPREFRACYKGRPRVALIQVPYHRCPAEHFKLCTLDIHLEVRVRVRVRVGVRV